MPALASPPENALGIWRQVDAVCFDVDCTITLQDSLDLLAEFMGHKEEVEALTHKAMDGSLNLAESLEERLKIINCTPADIRAFLRRYPPESRLAPNITKLIKTLQSRGVHVYLISGGFREILLPIAKYLGIHSDNIYANRMVWQWDDETLMPTRLAGFDTSEPTAQNGGKPQAISRIREDNPYNTVVMIGDGITDLEAVQETGGADLFIGYGGVVERSAVKEAAEWYIYDHQELIDALKRYRVSVVGSGSWASAITKIVASNTLREDDVGAEFDPTVRMWLHNDAYQPGVSLSEVINNTHENPKYLPGVSLGPNVRACTSLSETVQDADILVFCVPHQFMHNVCKQLVGKIRPGVVAVSLTKGIRVKSEGPQLISHMITKLLGIDCSVLMGPNIASEVAAGQFSEADLAYHNESNAMLLLRLLQTPTFQVNLLPDVVGAELCGTLKNVVALAAGMVDGLQLGHNTKAAIMAQGIGEIRRFCKALYRKVRDDTFFESCGVGDLIATCYGGRNRHVAEAFTQAFVSGQKKSFAVLEKELLSGQKLQGVLTSDEVQQVLVMKGWEADYPLFTTINRIVHGLLPPTAVVNYRDTPLLCPTSSSDDDDPILQSPKAGSFSKGSFNFGTANRGASHSYGGKSLYTNGGSHGSNQHTSQHTTRHSEAAPAPPLSLASSPSLNGAFIADMAAPRLDLAALLPAPQPAQVSTTPFNGTTALNAIIADDVATGIAEDGAALKDNTLEIEVDAVMAKGAANDDEDDEGVPLLPLQIYSPSAAISVPVTGNSQNHVAIKITDGTVTHLPSDHPFAQMTVQAVEAKKKLSSSPNALPIPEWDFESLVPALPAQQLRALEHSAERSDTVETFECDVEHGNSFNATMPRAAPLVAAIKGAPLKPVITRSKWPRYTTSLKAQPTSSPMVAVLRHSAMGVPRAHLQPRSEIEECDAEYDVVRRECSDTFPKVPLAGLDSSVKSHPIPDVRSGNSFGSDVSWSDVKCKMQVQDRAGSCTGRGGIPAANNPPSFNFDKNGLPYINAAV